MVPRSRDGSSDDAEAPIDPTVDAEVTRVEGIRYLEGASGHGVLSLLFLLAAAALAEVGRTGAAVMALVIAYGVALNGLSIYAWDRLRTYFASVVRGTDDGPSRALVPHRISTEMKAELLAGFAMVGGFVVALGVALGVVRAVGPGLAVPLAVGTLAAGNLLALGRTYYASPGR